MSSATTGRRLFGALVCSPLALLGLTKAGHAETSIADDRTATVRTSTVNSGGSDDISITSEGSITVTSGAAVEVDSSNTLANSGQLLSTDASSTTGVLAHSGVSGAITNSGLITLTETYTVDDDDDDGDADGAFAAGSNRIGILAEGAFTGNITNADDAAITIEGNDSAGVRLLGPLSGALTNEGSIGVTGDRAVGVDILAPISGDVALNGAISAVGLDAVAANIAGAIGGELTIRGSLYSTGFRYTSRPSDADDRAILDADDLLAGGSALAIRASVARGVTIAGIGVEDDDDDDGDGLVEDVDGDGVVDSDDDSDDDVTGSVTSYGPAPALLITSAESAADVVIGVTDRGYGLVNRGAISAYGVFDGVTATGLYLQGGASRLVIEGGVLQDRSIGAISYEANAYGVRIGAGAETPLILNRGSITATSTSEGDFTAFALLTEAGANVPAIINRGAIAAYLYGEEGDAVAFRDLSGAVTSFDNAGAIVAYVAASDADTDDDVTPVASGRAIALDFSANSTGVTITQTPAPDFTDDDSTDDSSSLTPTIIGDLLLGSGADMLDVSAGAITGDLYFGLGDDTFRLRGATFDGAIFDADGRLSIEVADAVLTLGRGRQDITAATFASGANLLLHLPSADAEGTLLAASGDVSFAPGALITPIIPSVLPADGAYVFLEAGALAGAENVTGALAGDGVSYLYFIDIGVSASNANALEAVYRRKTAADLGLSPNQTAIYEPLVAAVQRDEEAAGAFSGLDDAEGFERAYDRLMPNYAAASAQLAAAGIDESARAATDHLARRLREGTWETEAWVQELGFFASREAAADGVDYDGWGFGFAGGVDAPLNSGPILGLALAFMDSETSKSGADNEFSNMLGQADVYLGAKVAFMNFDVLVGGGVGRMQSRRVVAIGEDFERTAGADWWTFESHARGGLSAPFQLFGGLEIAPRLGVSYLAYWEDAYAESGGGDAVDLQADKTFSQVLNGEATLDLAWRIGGETFALTPRLRAGWREPLARDAAERTFRFVSGGDAFTLIDEPLDEGGALFGLGLEGGDSDVSVAFSYEGQVLDAFERHSVSAAVRLKF